MGIVAQAVLEFDDAVQGPWRPPLEAPGPRGERALLRAVETRSSHEAGSVVRRAGAPRARRRAAAPCHPGAVDSSRRADGRRVGGVPARSHARPVLARPAAPVRLTRRARRLVAVFGLGFGLAMGSWFGALVAGADGGLRLVADSSVTVRSGDSLWSIASSVAGDEDVREVVDRIQEINGLAGVSVLPGQVLRLP